MNDFEYKLTSQLNYFLSNFGRKAIINDDSAKIATILLKEIDDKTNDGLYDCKYLFCKVDLPINQGDYLTINNIKYLAIHEDEPFNGVYKRFIIKRIVHIINFNNKGNIVKVPAIIQTTIVGAKDKEYVRFAVGKIRITIPDTNDNKFIKIDNRIITMASAWKITGITTEDKGLKHLYLEKDLFSSSYDDVENEVADRWQYENKPEDDPNPQIKPVEPPEKPKPLEYKLTENMGFSIHRFNTNTFIAHKFINGAKIPCKFEYKIDYNSLNIDVIEIFNPTVDDLGIKIRNKKCKNGEIIYLLVLDEGKEVIRQEIKLINF